MAATGASAASSGQPGRDAVLVLLSKTVRSLAYGCVAVILAIYLKQVGLEESAIGLILSAASAGGAVVTIGISGVADRIGRRRALAISGVVMAGSALIFAFTSDLRLLVIASFVGTVSNTGTELGPFTPIEQALLP
ncbi:MAG: MFS transporter, partial [Chloroflexi bacterium]|nr:MFS transporter [Chloroflexota bacterium]